MVLGNDESGVDMLRLSCMTEYQTNCLYNAYLWKRGNDDNNNGKIGLEEFAQKTINNTGGTFAEGLSAARNMDLNEDNEIDVAELYANFGAFYEIGGGDVKQFSLNLTNGDSTLKQTLQKYYEQTKAAPSSDTPGELPTEEQTNSLYNAFLWAGQNDENGNGAIDSSEFAQRWAWNTGGTVEQGLDAARNTSQDGDQQVSVPELFAYYRTYFQSPDRWDSPSFNRRLANGDPNLLTMLEASLQEFYAA
jgi:hypothetical protein